MAHIAATGCVRMNYDRLHETKLVNTLVPDAEPGKAATFIVEWASFPILRGGGQVKITDTHLVFEPNSVNKLAHTNDTSFAVPLKSISEVTVEPGFVTKIIAGGIGSGQLVVRF